MFLPSPQKTPKASTSRWYSIYDNVVGSEYSPEEEAQPGTHPTQDTSVPADTARLLNEDGIDGGGHRPTDKPPAVPTGSTASIYESEYSISPPSTLRVYRRPPEN